MAGRGKGKLKVFIRRCVDEECGYVHSMQVRKNNPGFTGEICPSCFNRLSYLDFNHLDWLNATYLFTYVETDQFIEEDQLMAGLAWAND